MTREDPALDLIDGCDLDFAAEPTADVEVALTALFPDGKGSVKEAREWQKLFAESPKLRTLAPLSAAAYSGSGYDTGIADRLRRRGLHVVEIAGWQTRGSSSFYPRGSVDHHTAGGRGGLAPSLNICINGRAGLSGPLCNILIGRDNTVYVIAAGRANHAGLGGWRGLSGNSSVYGVERENVGTAAEPWREDQTDTAAKVHAALIEGRAGAEMVCEHKEWAPSRKIDAHTISGDDMRSRVTFHLMGGGGSSGGGGEPVPVGRRIPKDRQLVQVPWKPRHVWAVAEDGGVFNSHKGDFYGSMGGKKMNAPVVALIPTPTGKGYWLVGADNGLFAFGDAKKAKQVRPYKPFFAEYARGERAIVGGYVEIRKGVSGLAAFDPKNWRVVLVGDTIPMTTYRL